MPSCLQVQLATLLQQWRPAHLPALLVLWLDLERTLMVVWFPLQLSQRGLPGPAREPYAINEELRQVASQRGSRVVNGEESVWPVVLAAFGEGSPRVAQYSTGLGISVFVVGRADGEARADAPSTL